MYGSEKVNDDDLSNDVCERVVNLKKKHITVSNRSSLVQRSHIVIKQSM